MYEQPPQDNVLFFMLYAAVTMLNTMAGCYLFFRRGNAFAPDITTPPRLRRWTATLFAIMALCHLWYFPIVYSTSLEDVKLIYFIGGLLDSLTFLPVAFIVFLSMLQDRKRPLWPVALSVAPLALGIVWCIVSRSDALLSIMNVYLLLLSIGVLIYMVRAIRQYGHWLRDNFADLEHKEVWLSFMVMVVILLFLSIYASGFGGAAYKYMVQVADVILVCSLLWRVETLSDLSVHRPQDNALSQAARDDIGSLLKQHCIDTKLYLQHDLSLSELAAALGTNRTYLSQYFSSQDTTYNIYINDLRIQHFIDLYHEAVATEQSFTAQQLAHDSGYRSYSTFGLAFKQRIGQTVSAWIRETTK